MVSSWAAAKEHEIAGSNRAMKYFLSILIDTDLQVMGFLNPGDNYDT